MSTLTITALKVALHKCTTLIVPIKNGNNNICSTSAEKMGEGKGATGARKEVEAKQYFVILKRKILFEQELEEAWLFPTSGLMIAFYGIAQHFRHH
ncbi:hypothetical protein CHS0354_033680 [Potamilus streckersoni]|uniref:Uncharacterized protein n=1 Tax=Potamilus streckersoni TaxID=2493646 RepID=A0AAE0S261_9BIVA|nr:hypothetical protein CHS0354_033680 [Potamilus streckersoni]